MCGQGREGVKMSIATELKLPLKLNLTPEEQQLSAQLLAFNLINIDFVDWNDVTRETIGRKILMFSLSSYCLTRQSTRY